jgi:hypothetical protein
MKLNLTHGLVAVTLFSVASLVASAVGCTTETTTVFVPTSSSDASTLPGANSSPDKDKNSAPQDNGGNSSGGQDKGTTTKSCSLSEGTYHSEYTLKTPGPNCSEIPDQDVEYKLPTGDAGTQTQPGCTQDVDEASCTTTITCDRTTGGSKATSVSKFTVKSEKSAEGEIHSTIEVNGEPFSDCTWTYTWTKK